MVKDCFTKRYKNVFSMNIVAAVLSDISGYSKNTFKTDLIKKNFSKILERMSVKNPEIVKFYEKEKVILQENDLSYRIEKYSELLSSSYEMEKNYVQKSLYKARYLLGLLEVLNGNENSQNEKEKILNFLIKEKILNKEEIENILKNKKVIYLKIFHYLFCIFASIYFFKDEKYETYIIDSFKKKKNFCKENLLKRFFNNPYCNIDNDEKRNVRNIINQKHIMRFNTFKKYFSKIEDELLYLYYYSFYLYLDYLEFLKKELKIDEETFCKFIEEIKKKKN